EFEVYPNPVHEIVFINTDQLPEAYEVIIQDVNGRVVMQAGTVDRMDVSQLQRGIYLFRISANGELVTRKFIKE
ncbi:MAG: Secretion system C-terminal sorting domain, partial [Bacteroidota bacterium]